MHDMSALFTTERKMYSKLTVDVNENPRVTTMVPPDPDPDPEVLPNSS